MITKNTFYQICLLFIFFHSSWSQTIFSENIGNPNNTSSITNNIFENNNSLSYSNGGQNNAADVRITNASTGYNGASSGGNIFFSATSGAYGFSIEGINASNYTSLTLQFGYRKEAASMHASFAVDYWNGSSWEIIANTETSLFNEATNATAKWYLSKALTLPAAAQINGLKIRFVKTGTASIRIDDIVLSGIEQTPPTVLNTGVANITKNSTTFNGEVTATGGSDIIVTGTVYSITAINNNPKIGGTGVSSVNTTNPNSGTGTFSNNSGTLLLSNVQYSYNAYATKTGGATGYGTAAAFYTLAETPSAPIVSNPTQNSLTITIGTDANSNSTTYAIFESITGTYVQTNGTLNTSPVFQTAANWGNKIISGLSPNTTYSFQGIAKNGSGSSTIAGAAAQGTTLAIPSSSSDIIFNSSSSASSNTNINYQNYQADVITSTANSIGVMGFYLRDGGAGHNDADSYATELTAISFTVTNSANIRSARLFVGNTPKGISVPVVNNSITFTGLTDIIATDNSQLAINLRVTFNTTVTDNKQIKFTISSVTANSTGSQFAMANGGGASSSMAGDINKIEVTADRLAFVQQPPASLTAGTSMSPSPVVSALDGNGNLDLDFIGIITLSTSGNLNIPLDIAAITGVSTFDYNIMDFTASTSSVVMTASSTGLNSVVSNSFEVLVSPEIVLLDLPLANCTIDNCNLVVNGGFESGNPPTNIGQITNACGWFANRGTPDYFNSGTTLANVSIPCNFTGGQSSNNSQGFGYAGILFTGLSSEIMVSKLSTPLIAGQNYQLSFDVSLAEGMSSFSKTVQAYLSHTIPTTANAPIVIDNQQMVFSKTTTSTISDGWETLTFDFTAAGEEEYIYLGSFQNVISQPNPTASDPTCTYSNSWNNPIFSPAQYAYYYLDNVSIVPLNPTIDAVNDDFSTSSIYSLTGGTTASVFANDTVDGVTATGSTVIPSIIGVTPTMSPLPTIDANGIITIPAGTAVGTYTIEYEIVKPCNNLSDTAYVTVVVVAGAPPITNCLKLYVGDFCYNATQSQTTLSSIFTAGCEIAMIGNVPCDSSNVTIEMLTPLEAGCTMNANGTITIAAGTKPFEGLSVYQLRSVQYPSITSVPMTVGYSIKQRVNTNYTTIGLYGGSGPKDVYYENVNILTRPIVSTINPNTDGSCGLIDSAIGPSFIPNTVTIVETTNPPNYYYKINTDTGFVEFRWPYTSNNMPPIPPLTHNDLTYTMCINNTVPAAAFCNDGIVVIYYYFSSNREMGHVKEQNNLDIHPNPSADGKFTLLFEQEINNGTVEVYNLLGQKVKQERMLHASELLLDMSTTATGTYLLKIQDGVKQVVKRLVIK